MNSMPYKDSDIVVAVDIGTTKVCAIAGRQNEHGKIDILGVAKTPCEGVKRGVVSNIEKTVNAIQSAIAIVEKQIKAKVKIVHLGIAGQHIKSLQHHGILTRDDAHDEISKADIDRLIQDMHKLVLPPGDTILHVIPQEYTVDNEQGIIDPIGMSGIRLEAVFHIITAQINAIKNIKKCIKKAGLDIADITLEPIASSEAVLSREEKEAGIALVDIGGGTTDLTIFHEGIIRHTAVIPFGGDIITKDVKEGCTIMQNQAEKLKQKFGSALASEVWDNRVITIPGLKGREPKEISEKNLSLIIQARIEEIFDYIMWEIRRSGYEKKLIGGIVLTGGGSRMKHVSTLIEFYTGIPTRIGYPVEYLAHGYNEELSSPIFSTAVGLLMRGLENRTYDSSVEQYPTHEEPVGATIEMEVVNTLAAITSDQPDDVGFSPEPLVEETVVNEVDNTPHLEKESRLKKMMNRGYTSVKQWFEATPDTDL